MEYAIIQDGTVVNVIVADAGFVAIYYPDSVRIDNVSPKPGIGWGCGSGPGAPLFVRAPLVEAAHGQAITPVKATASGGSGAGYAFSASGLPSGLTMTPDGRITGTPAAASVSTYTVTVTDSVESVATGSAAAVVG